MMNGNLIFNKKGQLTPIIIIAIIVVVGILVYFSVGDSSNQRIVDPEIAPIYNYVEGCLKESAAEAIIETSKYGGYTTVPERSLENGIPYYMQEGKNLMPSKEKVESEIARYIDNSVYFCIKEFSDFPDFNIKDSDRKISADIENEIVNLEVNYPLSISKGENSYRVNDFRFNINARLGQIYEEVTYLMEDQVKHPDSLCILCAREVSANNDLYVSTINYDADTVIFTIRDEKVKIDNQDLVFSYVIELEEYEL